MITLKKDCKNLQLPDSNQKIPQISLILRYELKMKNKPDLFNLLMMRADRAEKELLNNFPKEKVEPVIQKLRKVIKEVDCPPNGKNIAIFISPSTEKVYYFTPSHLEKFKLPVLIKSRRS